MSNTTPVIRSRRPTGQVPLPFVLIEGEAKSGRTWAALRLSASPKVGRTFLLDLIDGIGDEYALIPGVDYEILVPAADEWTHADILDQILAVKAEALRARKAGEPPVLLVIDTMTALWNSLADWTTERAKDSKANRGKLARDPNADIIVPRHLWNATHKRYQKMIEALKTFPGIVLATANGREVSATGSDGQPVEGKKTYSVQAEKDIVGDATVTIRMRRTAPPEVVAARSAVNGLQPEKDEPKPITAPEAVGPDGNLLEWLIFTALGCDPATRHVRDVHAVSAGELTAEERGADPRADGFRDWALQVGHTHASLGALYEEVRQAGLIDAVVVDDHGDDVTLHDLINRLGRELPAPPPGPPSVAPPAPVTPTSSGANGHHPNGNGVVAADGGGRPPQYPQATLDWFASVRSRVGGATGTAALDDLINEVIPGCEQRQCPTALPEMLAHIERRREWLLAPIGPQGANALHKRMSGPNVKVKGDGERRALCWHWGERRHKSTADITNGEVLVIETRLEEALTTGTLAAEVARAMARDWDPDSGREIIHKPEPAGVS